MTQITNKNLHKPLMCHFCNVKLVYSFVNHEFFCKNCGLFYKYSKIVPDELVLCDQVSRLMPPPQLRRRPRE